MSANLINILNGRVQLAYPPGPTLRPTTDAVFLAAACLAAPGERVLDLGCGAGVVGACIAARVPGVELYGVDADLVNIDYAQRNLGRFAEYQVGDVTQPKVFGSTWPRMDHAVCNPPFFDPQDNDITRRGMARAMMDGVGLQSWVQAALPLLKIKGSLTVLINTPRLPELLEALARDFGAVEIIPLWPRDGVAAKRLVVRAIKGRSTPLSLLPGLVLHHADGTWTNDAERILIHGQGLE